SHHEIGECISRYLSIEGEIAVLREVPVSRELRLNPVHANRDLVRAADQAEVLRDLPIIRHPRTRRAVLAHWREVVCHLEENVAWNALSDSGSQLCWRWDSVRCIADHRGAAETYAKRADRRRIHDERVTHYGRLHSIRQPDARIGRHSQKIVLIERRMLIVGEE